VATADTLSRASDWLHGQPLDLILVELNGLEPEQIAAWADANQVDVGDIVLMGADQPMSTDVPFGGELPTVFDLSTLLNLVREMNRVKETPR
jgi:hypothetical protein